MRTLFLDLCDVMPCSLIQGHQHFGQTHILPCQRQELSPEEWCSMWHFVVTYHLHLLGAWIKCRQKWLGRKKWVDYIGRLIGMWPTEPWKGETQVQDLFLFLFASFSLACYLQPTYIIDPLHPPKSLKHLSGYNLVTLKMVAACYSKLFTFCWPRILI